MNHSDLLKLTLESFENFVIVDENANVFYINEMYARLLGGKQKELIGKPVTEVIPGTRLPEIVQTGKPQTGDIMTLYDHEHQTNVSLICNRIPLIEDGKVRGAAAFTTFDSMENLFELHNLLVQMEKENRQYKEELEQLRMQQDPLQIIGTSPQMLALKNTISEFAKSNLSVLLTGETGTGKEVFASALHNLSNRSMNAFVKINCAAIPKDLLESELFGYEEGSFTGAKKSGKPGKFELADNGTLMLDEIGEMPMPLQSKLLRVLQEHEIERIGATEPKKINVRIICSTNQNIPAMIREGSFREDLYYRINTVEMHIPPLRERLSDLPALCSYLIRKINLATDGNTLGIADDALRLFETYRWPGNVRELEHVLERLCFQCQNVPITAQDCGFLRERIDQSGSPDAEIQKEPERTPDPAKKAASLKAGRKEAETELILCALEECGGNKAAAAKLLGIDRSSLYYKLKKYQINY